MHAQVAMTLSLPLNDDQIKWIIERCVSECVVKLERPYIYVHA